MKNITIRGIDPEPEYHDLDDLAGTWSKEDEEEFDRVQTGLAEIDEELWK